MTVKCSVTLPNRVGLQRMIVVFTDLTHLLFNRWNYAVCYEQLPVQKGGFSIKIILLISLKVCVI